MFRPTTPTVTISSHSHTTSPPPPPLRTPRSNPSAHSLEIGRSRSTTMADDERRSRSRRISPLVNRPKLGTLTSSSSTSRREPSVGCVLLAPLGVQTPERQRLTPPPPPPPPSLGAGAHKSRPADAQSLGHLAAQTQALSIAPLPRRPLSLKAHDPNRARTRVLGGGLLPLSSTQGGGRPSSPKPYAKPPSSVAPALPSTTLVAPRPIPPLCHALLSLEQIESESPVATGHSTPTSSSGALAPSASTALRRIQARDTDVWRRGKGTPMRTTHTRHSRPSTPNVRRAATTTHLPSPPPMRPTLDDDTLTAPISPFALPLAVTIATAPTCNGTTSRPLRLGRHSTDPAPTSPLAASFDSHAAYERVKSEQGYVRFDDVVGLQGARGGDNDQDM